MAPFDKSRLVFFHFIVGNPIVPDMAAQVCSRRLGLSCHWRLDMNTPILTPILPVRMVVDSLTPKLSYVPNSRDHETLHAQIMTVGSHERKLECILWHFCYWLPNTLRTGLFCNTTFAERHAWPDDVSNLKNQAQGQCAGNIGIKEDPILSRAHSHHPSTIGCFILFS